MVVLSQSREIADFIDAIQFQWRAGKPLSQFMCGYFAVWICRAMAQVGKPPTLSVAQVIADAEASYRQYDGSDDGSNTRGMTDGQLYALLHQVGLHYQQTAKDINVVKAWLKVGYPVILGVTETSVYDVELKGNPYTSWHPAGTHIIDATGVRSDGNVLVRDSANCTNLYDPNSLRPGPRAYDAAKLVLVSATVCVPPWLPRPASGVPPAVAPVPIEPPHPGLSFSADDTHVWNLLKSGVRTDTGIAQEWLRARRHSMEIGPVLEAERAITENGLSYAVQRFVGAEAWWKHATGGCTWFDGRGSFTIPK